MYMCIRIYVYVYKYMYKYIHTIHIYTNSHIHTYIYKYYKDVLICCTFSADPLTPILKHTMKQNKVSSNPTPLLPHPTLLLYRRIPPPPYPRTSVNTLFLLPVKLQSKVNTIFITQN